MKDNLILNILIKAVVCFSKKVQKPKRFPQRLEMVSVCATRKQRVIGSVHLPTRCVF